MSQIYWNEPPRGYAMTAEEFAAGACRRPAPQPCPPQTPGCGCDCGPAPMPPTDCGCGCGTMPGCPDNSCGQGPEHCQQMVCCCRPVPGSKPQPPQVEEGCCCKQSFRAALGLLCDEGISSLLDFDTAAFITNTYTAGTTLTCGKPSAGDTAGDDTESAAAQADTDDTGESGDTGDTGKPTPTPPCCPSGASDNLGTLSGSFRRFSPCSCDLLDIEAQLYTAQGKDCSFTASQVSLCQLDAVVIQAASACPEGDLTGPEVTARNFRCLRQRLAQRLNPCGDPCGQSCCSCACDGRDCCCAAGLLSTLAQNNLSRRVSLAAGPLLLNNVTLLGTVGNVLVLANDCDNRLYFVCVNSVQFIG